MCSGPERFLTGHSAESLSRPPALTGREGRTAPWTSTGAHRRLPARFASRTPTPFGPRSGRNSTPARSSAVWSAAKTDLMGSCSPVSNPAIVRRPTPLASARSGWDHPIRDRAARHCSGMIGTLSLYHRCTIHARSQFNRAIEKRKQPSLYGTRVSHRRTRHLPLYECGDEASFRRNLLWGFLLTGTLIGLGLKREPV